MGTKKQVESLKKRLLRYQSIGIDSMCFIYQFEGHPIYGPLVKELFSLLQQENISGVTSVLTLSEILAFERLQKDQLLFEEARFKFLTTPGLQIIPVNEIVAESASILKFTYHLTLPDAIQLASSILTNQTNQQLFITNDQKFRTIKEIEVLLLDEYINI